MGYHTLRDSLSCISSGISLGLSGKKYFSRNTESATFRETLDAVSVKVPAVEKEGSFPAECRTPAGVLSPVVHVLQWKGDGFPVIIYHHWSHEHPVDSSARRIFLNNRTPFNANVILVQAAYHESAASFHDCADNLSSFVTMIMTSVAVIEELVKNFSAKKVPVYVCGVKLGGWITNLHHAFYNSAKAYIPIMAGAGLGDIFFDSSFSSRVSSRAKQANQKVRRLLNFDDLFMATGNHANVYPLLAKYDKVSNYYRQKTCYGDIPVGVMLKGHVTGASSWKEIRTHISRSVERIKR
ncbi:MAG: hypothetical protein ACRCUT_12495 [Spirochaetota bacterium]